MSYDKDSVDSIDVEGSEDTTVHGTIPKKRKLIEKRSDAWEHFTKIVVNGIVKGKCLHCAKEIRADPHLNGTSVLRKHINSCKSHPHATETKQTQLRFHHGDDCVNLGTWRFDQEEARKALSYMIIIDELPFKFVENIGFIHFMSVVQPYFKIPSRWTLSRDCFGLYTKEKAALKAFMKKSCNRVCLTTDCWTSIQNINYLCLTAHFIDNNWRLHKRILNFCPIVSHKGKDIGQEIEKCLIDWGIDKVFTITVDNASSNDSAVKYLKDKIINWGSGILGGEHLHMRCIAHIINLVVQDGLKDVHYSIKKVRAAVKYIRQSPSRLNKFKECVEREKIQSKGLLCLDVVTRWNSTYLMLETAHKFERAFERFDDQEKCFSFELVDEKGNSMKPDFEDWANVRKLVVILKHFYDLTLKISGSHYVTSNHFFPEIYVVYILLKELEVNEDPSIAVMALFMRQKYDKYWGDFEKTNKMIFFSVILDPRHKLRYLEFAFESMHGGERGSFLLSLVREQFIRLFNEYKALVTPESSQFDGPPSCSSSFSTVTFDEDPNEILALKIRMGIKKKMSENRAGDPKTEMDKYLQDEVELDVPNFEILAWWKLNSHRYPVLSHMARDVLAIPISTVASESAFSTSGRILDPFRSSLTPKIVQSLVCTQDWFRAMHAPISVEEDLLEIEELEKDVSGITMDEVSTNDD